MCVNALKREFWSAITVNGLTFTDIWLYVFIFKGDKLLLCKSESMNLVIKLNDTRALYNIKSMSSSILSPSFSLSTF